MPASQSQHLCLVGADTYLILKDKVLELEAAKSVVSGRDGI